jgi:hypothetical protein
MEVGRQFYAPVALPLGKTAVLDGRLVRLQSRSGCFGQQKNLFSLQGIEPRFLGFQPVTIPTELKLYTEAPPINSDLNAL